MGQTAKRIATYEDLYSIPENMVGEIIDGELIVRPRPSPKHSRSSSVMGSEVLGPYQLGKGGPGGWWILDEVEVQLGKDILVPDLAGWKKERLPELPNNTNWIDIPPDWICEVLSPGTFRIDRIKKMPLYAEFGVAYFWLIDPVNRALEVFRLESGRWVVLGVHGEDDRVRAEPFQEVEIDLKNLW